MYGSAIIWMTMVATLGTVSCRLSIEDDYDRMPPLFHYEDEPACYQNHPSSDYCVVRSVIKPDPHNLISNSIEKYSRLAAFQEHSMLDRGVCVASCMSTVAELSEERKQQLIIERRTADPYFSFAIPSDKKLDLYRKEYTTLLNICINHRLQLRYNLSAYSEIERCTTRQDSEQQITFYHVAFIVVVALLLSLVACATIQDFSTFSPQHGNHTAMERSSWMEFSLQRNLRKLFFLPNTRLGKDFAFVNIFRLFSMVTILLIHIPVSYIAAASYNIKILENFFNHPVLEILTSVFTFQVHTFYSITGALLAAQFLEYASTRPKVRWSFLVQAIVMRWLRSVPILFIAWLYQVSWLDRLRTGPGSYRAIDLEAHNCRTNGWMNFLFMNNFFFGGICMHQSWYLAADFQLYIVGVILLILVTRYPRLVKSIFGAMVCLSFVLPIYFRYQNKLPGVLLVSFKHARYFGYAIPAVKDDYVLPHTSTASYFYGMIAGFIYYKFRTNPSIISRNRMFNILKVLAPAMVILQSALSPFFYNVDVSSAALFNAIYAALHRNFWAITCAVGIVYGTTQWAKRDSWIAINPITMAMSRLSFGFFIVQFNVLRYLVFYDADYGANFNMEIFLRISLYSVLLCYGLAFLLNIVVEEPFATISKRFLSPSKGKTDDKTQ